jgi:hypothetical protein
MKKLQIILIIFILVNNLNAQEYYSFDTTQVYWNEFYESGDWGPDNIFFSSYFISGDTLIDNHKFFKIYTLSDNDSIYIGAFREFNKLVLYNGLDYWGFNTDTSIVLYDFNKNLGDTVHTGTYHQSVIVEIDSIPISGAYRKRYKMEGDQYWIEGIGSTRGFLYPMTAIPTMYWHSELTCFKQMENMVYLNPSFTDCTTRIVSSVNDLGTNNSIEIYPNPSERGRDIIIKSTKITIAKIQFFNQLGTLLSSINCSKKNLVQIDIADYEPGVYIALIFGTKGEVIKRKLVIK